MDRKDHGVKKWPKKLKRAMNTRGVGMKTIVIEDDPDDILDNDPDYSIHEAEYGYDWDYEEEK